MFFVLLLRSFGLHRPDDQMGQRLRLLMLAGPLLFVAAPLVGPTPRRGEL